MNIPIAALLMDIKVLVLYVFMYKFIQECRAINLDFEISLDTLLSSYMIFKPNFKTIIVI